MHLSENHLRQIAEHQPRPRSEYSLMKAAVAIILRDGEQGTEFLMMQRAHHELDPWSGQMSFPGGKIDATDDSAKAAAIRETEEEVGIMLTGQDYVGQLDDLYGLKVDNQYSVHVSCFVFKPQRPLNPVGNHEVADLVWVSLAWLHDANNAHDYRHPQSPKINIPAVMINSEKAQVLWGLSLRMVSILHELLEIEIPVLTEAEQQRLKQIEKHNMSAKDIDGITRRILDRGAK